MHRLIAALLVIAGPAPAQSSEDEGHAQVGAIRHEIPGTGLVVIDVHPEMEPLLACIVDTEERLLLRNEYDGAFLQVLLPDQVVAADGDRLLVCSLYGSGELSRAAPRPGAGVFIARPGLELVRRCHDERASLTRAVGDAPEFHAALRAMQEARSRASRTIIGFGDTTVRLGEAEPVAVELVVPLQFEPERHQIERFLLPPGLRISGVATPILLDADAPTSSSPWDLELADLRTGTRARLSFDWSCPRRKRLSSR